LTIYSREAHPYDNQPMNYSYDLAGNPIAQPTTYEERLENVRKVIEEAEILMPVLVDPIDNPMWCSYGQKPNNAYLIGMDGKVVVYQDWNDAIKMEKAILEYLEE
jgi:hypothetical protein